MIKEIGKKYLITTDNWFVAPNGEQYRSVFGTLKEIHSDEVLGIKTNSRSANWYVEIGNMLIAGCQIHYAVQTDGVDFGQSSAENAHEGKIIISKTPCRIYNADKAYE